MPNFHARLCMPSRLNSAFRLALGLALVGATAPASTHPLVPPAATEVPAKLRAEIDQFRKKLAQTAGEKNAQALTRFYARDFSHIHTSGKVDGREARVVSLIAAEPTVELAHSTELVVSCYGPSICVLKGLSPIKRMSDGKWNDVRWTQTLVKSPTGWQIAASQATGLANTVRDNP